jgi:UDP-N-acetylmuramyl pentapeptide phosphotransferase/UDP-N-acetylglucosamine-1-phosphate transferase
MQILLISFFAALLVTMLVVRTARLHGGLSEDSDLAGPQKFHVKAVPRVGGLGVVMGAFCGFGLYAYQSRHQFAMMGILLAASAPAFLMGFTEDLTKRVGILTRLLATMISGLLAAWWLGAVVMRTDMPWVDMLLHGVPFVAWIFTVFAVGGIANAINIIDGFNGLASMVAMLMFGSMAYVALELADALVLGIALMMMGAIAGFFIWNFPGGHIFLGDGGAYFIGFMLAETMILLVLRNPAVSAWYAILVFVYPLFETMFSVYRRTVINGASPGTPDGVHLHSIIYRRVVRWVAGSKTAAHITMRNSMTSPYLWLLSSLAIVPATVWWQHTWVMMAFVLLFCVTYVLLYLSIIRFRVPRWLVMRKRS